MLHDRPELRPILLRFELVEGGQLVGEGIFRHSLHQFHLPRNISFAVKFVGLTVEFVDLDLGNQDVLQTICKGRGGRDCIGEVTCWS